MTNRMAGRQTFVVRPETSHTLRFVGVEVNSGSSIGVLTRGHGRETSPRATIPSPTPLDSGLRRNDDWGAGLTKGCREWRMRGCWNGLSRIGVRDMLS